jgi:hypothetical protein
MVRGRRIRIRVFVYDDEPYRNTPPRRAASGGQAEGTRTQPRGEATHAPSQTLSVILMQQIPNPKALLLAAAVALETTRALAAPIVVSTAFAGNQFATTSR